MVSDRIGQTLERRLTIPTASQNGCWMRNSFLITKTLELDEYEFEKEAFKSRSEVFMANAVALAQPSNDFRGTARKAAKLSVAAAETETFNDLKDLIDTFRGIGRKSPLFNFDAKRSGV